MEFVFAPPAQAAVPVIGGGWFPVRRIFCVGRNYADHVREMGGDPDRVPPTFFTKPADAVAADGADIAYPPGTNNLHHEVELVVALGQGGRDIPAQQARDWIYGYAVGNDLTRRDLQAQAKAGGHPWDLAKAFDQSAPLSAINPVAMIGHPDSGEIRLSVNDVVRQQADLRGMIWSVPDIVARLSQLFELRPGDLIFTGTPEGVGPLVPGDRVEASIAGVGTLRHRIVQA